MYNKKNAKVGIVDWTYAHFQGLPLLDLLNFFTISYEVISKYKESRRVKLRQSYNLGIISFPLPTPSNFKSIFYEDNQYSCVVKKYINKYCKEINLDNRLRRILFLAFVFEHLNYEKDFLDIAFKEEERNIILADNE